MKNRIKTKLYNIIYIMLNFIKRYLPSLHRFMKIFWLKKSYPSDKYKDLLFERFIRTNPTEEEINVFKENLNKHAKVHVDTSKAKSISKLLNSIKFESKNIRFFYNIDVYQMEPDINRLMVNNTFDYELILNSSITDLRMDDVDEFSKENNIICDALNQFVDKCVNYLENSSHDNKKEIINWLSNIKNKKASHFEEALQRVLFYNMILWQTNHRLVGLGRLDLILNDLYESDKKNGFLDREKASIIIIDFLSCLHQYYWFKSDALLGDTGQIIILGGKQKDGTYFYNDLTWAFIDAVERIQKPDPKVLLRVSENTPLEFVDKSIDCIKTGLGNPLFSNDDRVIPSMIHFGYEKDDAYNYVTSACWEPLIPATSEQNNIGLYNFLLPIQMICEKENLTKFNTFDQFLQAYKSHLCGHIDYINNLLNEIKWEPDPLFSFANITCKQMHIDIGHGGGKYNNFGVLSIALSNAVNALLNLKKYVFEEKLFDLQFLDIIRKNNYRSHEDIQAFLRNNKFFGSDNDEALNLSKDILETVNNHVKTFTNIFGGKIKFGLSSPGYIQAATDFPASFDGRSVGEPFAVHISGDDSASFTELMQFASKLDYSDCRFNGNVTDFFVSPNLIDNNQKKFSKFLLDSFKLGVFQTQFNVVNSKTLIAARDDPKSFPNLIVRVWGFSAYFIELPKEYKDYLIERAVKCESMV